MKKVFLMLGVIATILTSCTDNGEDKKDANAVIEKTSIIANISTDQQTQTQSLTGKNVNRGSIYAWVQSIDVTATSTAWLYSTSEHFDLVSTGGASNFTIENVALGANTFNATTTTNTAPVCVVTKVTGKTASALKTELVAHNPYAVYTGNANATISSTALNTIDLNMTTLNGRVVSVFSFENDAILRANTKAKISVTVSDTNGDNPTTFVSPFFSNDELISFEWSDATSVVGKKASYIISIYDNNDALVSSYPVVNPTVIKGSTSISCTYEINREKVINVNADEIKFTWQIWENLECETTYDNDGYNCLGYDREGYDREGYNRNGFNKCGWHKAPNVFYNAQQDKDLSDGNSKAKCQ